MSDRLKYIGLLIVWALFVAVRNTVFDNHQWEYWFLIVLGAVSVFFAGRAFERTVRT